MEVVSGDNWSYKTCKAPVKSSSPTNQHPTFDRPDALPVDQPTGCPKKTWWDCVKNDMESLGLSQKDAQSRNKWEKEN